MFFCEDPYIRFERGLVKGVSEVTQRVERGSVACGRCDSCIKNRKQDWTGKLLAESEFSGSTAFVTLTYKNEPDEFRYADVQAMLKSIRQKLARKRLGGVRFFCVGEKGDENGRKHWHLILFFQRNIQLERTTEGNLWEHWPYGWTSIEMLNDLDRRAQKIRYCVMYCLKGIGYNPGVRARSSLKPALGGEFVHRLAFRTAEQGLCPSGKYNIPGIKWGKGRKAGQHVDFTLQGANRRRFVETYAEAWVQFHGDRKQPMNDWLLRHQEDAVHPIFEKVRTDKIGFHTLGKANANASKLATTAQRALAELPEEKPVKTGDWFDVIARRMLVGPDWAAELCVNRRGEAWLSAGEGSVHRIDESIEEVLDLPYYEVVRLDKWLAMVRPMREMETHGDEEAQEAVEAERRAALGRVLEESCQRLREKHGTAPGIGGIYGRPLNPSLPDPFWSRAGKKTFGVPVRVPHGRDVPCEHCGSPHDAARACGCGGETESTREAFGFSDKPKAEHLNPEYWR